MHLITECSSSSNAFMICINLLGMLIVSAIGSANAYFIYIYAFSRRFYPKRLTIAFRLYIFYL